jgi:hypothetical protein
MLRNTTAGLPRVAQASRVIRTLLAVVCGRDFAKNDVSEQDVETCSKESGNPSTERLANDGNLVVNDYEDLKSTGYLEVVTLIAFDVNIVVS